MVKIVTLNVKELISKLVFSIILLMLFLFISIKYITVISLDINIFKYALNSIPIYNSYKEFKILEKINKYALKSANVFLGQKFEYTDIVNNKNYVENIKDNMVELSISDFNSKQYDINNNLNNININNTTSYDINYSKLLQSSLKMDKKTTILIVHTHGSESYRGVTHTDFYRTEDKQYNVVRVGNELENILKNSGYNVIHDENLYDYPTYNGSYTRALKNTQEKIDNNNNIGIVLDIHRDASANNEDFAPTTNINGESVSQLMIIAGTAEGGLEHQNWKENLKFALKLQNVGEQIYPGIFRPMTITRSRYNQHTTKGSLIIEVGATGNTLEQSIESMKYLAKILDVVLENNMEE